MKDHSLRQTPVARFQKRLLPALAILAFAGVLALYAAGVVLSGGSALGLVLYPAAFVAFVVLPGLWLAGLALPKAAAGVRAVAAVPLGGLAAMLLFVTLGRVAPPALCAVPLAAMAFAWGWGRRKTFKLPRFDDIPAPAWGLLLLFSAALFLYVFTGVLPYAKPGEAGNMVYSQDLLWSVGNAASAAYGAPVRDLRTAGGILHYHYFIDVLAGLVGLFVGQSAWDAVAYYCWPLWCAALCAALYQIARRFGAGRWAALMVPGGVLFAHTSWETSFRHIFVNANGVVQSNFFLAAAVLLVQQAEGEGFREKRTLAALLATLAALCWGKSTVGVLLACGLLAAALVGGLLRKKLNGWLLAAAGGGFALFGVLYGLIYRHAINNLVFQPSLSAVGDAFGILLYRYFPALLLYAVSLVFALRGFKNRTYAELLVNALVPGGILAYILFSHYSFSQSYFLLVACFAMWMCASRALSWLWGKKPLAAGMALLCAGSLAATLWYGEPVLRHGAQSALRVLELRPAFPDEPQAITPDDEAAANWLRENVGRGEVFATNRNARDPAGADGIFHYYTAASGRQAFVESWRYAMDYSVEYHLLRHNLEKVSDGIYAAATYEEAAAIARENDIDYILVHRPTKDPGWAGAQPAFESGVVAIYQVAR